MTDDVQGPVKMFQSYNDIKTTRIF